MHQSSRLEGVAARFASQFLRGQLAQLRVNQRQQLGGGLGITLMYAFEDARHVAHAADHSPIVNASEAGNRRRKALTLESY
jgi:hypothetical protein